MLRRAVSYFALEEYVRSDADYKKALEIDNTYMPANLGLVDNKNIKNIDDLSAYNSKLYALTKEIERFKKTIASCQQFNKKGRYELIVKRVRK